MISINDARAHLRIDGTQDDAEISAKMIIAEALIASYIGHLRGDVFGEPQPPEITAADTQRFRHQPALDAARLLILGDLWANRESTTGDPLSPSVKRLLEPFREPGYA